MKITLLVKILLLSSTSIFYQSVFHRAYAQTQSGCMSQALEQYEQCFDGIGEQILTGGFAGAAAGAAATSGPGAIPGGILGAGAPAVGRVSYCTFQYFQNRSQCPQSTNNTSNILENPEYNPNSSFPNNRTFSPQKNKRLNPNSSHSSTQPSYNRTGSWDGIEGHKTMNIDPIQYLNNAEDADMIFTPDGGIYEPNGS